MLFSAGPGWAVRPRASKNRGAATVHLLRAARSPHPPQRQEPGMQPEEEELSPLASLDLRAITATITEDEGDPILLIDDGDVQIELTSGMNGNWQDAITGSQRIASAALEFAAVLRRRLP